MGGRPKALLELGGRWIIERVVDAVPPAVDDLLIVTNPPELYAFLKLPMVADVYPDHGSLGGIYSGLRAAPGGAAFTVACDMPFLHADVVRLVVERVGSGDVVIPRVGGQLETLHADRKSTRLNSSHSQISYAVFCLKKKNKIVSAMTSHFAYPVELC